MNATIGFAEGPSGGPVDATSTMALFAFCSGQVPSTNALIPNVIALDAPPAPGFVCPNGDVLGYGPGPEAAHFVSRRGLKRVLLVPCTASTAGVLSAVTQTGSGPLVTVAAVAASTSPKGYSLPAGPFDDASVQAKVIAAGVPGVAQVQMSWSSVLVQGLPSPFWQGAITVPPRAPAQILGTVDLTTLTYATVATVTGTVDLTTVAWGPSITGTLILTLEGTGPTTVTFAGPASPAAAVAAINAATSSTCASINNQNRLVISGTVPGTTGVVVVGAGTANANVGLTAATTNGTAGTLDGLTLLFSDDTMSSQTVTFSTPKPVNPAAVVAKINAASGIAAAVYTAKNLLQLASTTLGSTSSLTVTGGTARTALGLPIVAAAGAESTLSLPHLGITVTFSPNSNSSFQVNTTYAWTTVAPKMSDADINARIADLDKSGQPYGGIYILSETDVVSSIARETNLDAQMTTEHTRDNMARAHFGFNVAELPANILANFVGYTSAWVDKFADGAWLTGGNIPGGGSVLRSTSWVGAMVDTYIPYYRDRGDRGISYGASITGLPDVNGITRDEGISGIKLVDVVGGSSTSCNVLEQDTNGGYYFAGGYSSAVSTSKYCDASTRNVILRVGAISASVLAYFLNSTALDTNTDGTLAPESAEQVQSAIETALSVLVPIALQADQALVNTSTNFYTLKSLAAAITGYNRVPVRSVSGVIAPGIVSSGN